MSGFQYDYAEDIMEDIVGFLGDLDDVAVISDGTLDDVTGETEDGGEESITFPVVLLNLQDTQEDFSNLNQSRDDQAYRFLLTVIGEIAEGEKRFAAQRSVVKLIYDQLQSKLPNVNWSVPTMEYAQVVGRKYINETDQQLAGSGLRLTAGLIMLEVGVNPQVRNP